MIFDNRYWQDELRRLASSLRRNAALLRRHPASDAAVEKCVMLGFYAIRKMLHSFNPPPTLENQLRLQLTVFPCQGPSYSPVFWPDVRESFDLDRPRNETHELEFVCNQIIHSHFFALWFNQERKLMGLFFSSDHFKDKKLFRLDLASIATLFEDIAESRRRIVKIQFAPRDNRITM